MGDEKLAASDPSRMPQTAAECVLTDENERILLWRAEVLERAGYDSTLAGVLSAVPSVDLHFAADLVKRGCPARVALRILL